jgi:hypothetical protein
VSETQKDEHGCLIGKEVYSEEQQKCVPANQTSNSESDSKVANTSVKLSMNEAYSKIVQLEGQVEEKDKLISSLTQHLDEANAILNSQRRSEQIKRISDKCNCPIEILKTKTDNELDIMEESLSYVVPWKLNSVRFGALGVGDKDSDMGLTVGDLSVVTAAKRKGA